jgi:hypothetical protein
MPLLIPPMILTTVLSAFGIARYSLRRVTRSRSKVLEELTHRLAEQARDSIGRRSVGPGSWHDRKLLG